MSIRQKTENPLDMRYKIILVPFPFYDLSELKVRPALCLTNLISGYQHIVIAFITSQISKANEPSDIKIYTTDDEFQMTGLRVDSAIQLHRLVTIPLQIISRELGILPHVYVDQVHQQLKKLFGI